ncbi:MAG: hypothetical protein ACPGC9_01465 [Cytophagales bacterium]
MALNDLMMPKLGLIFFQTVTMLLVLFIMKRFAWHHILDFIKQQERLYAAAEAKKTAALKLTADLEANRDQIIEEAKRQEQEIIAHALTTKAAYLEEAKIEGEQKKDQLIAEGIVLLKQQKQLANQEIKATMAGLVIQTTEKLLGVELDKKGAQEALLHRLINQTLKEQESKPT